MSMTCAGRSRRVTSLDFGSTKGLRGRVKRPLRGRAVAHAPTPIGERPYVKGSRLSCSTSAIGDALTDATRPHRTSGQRGLLILRIRAAARCTPWGPRVSTLSALASGAGRAQDRRLCASQRARIGCLFGHFTPRGLRRDRRKSRSSAARSFGMATHEPHDASRRASPAVPARSRVGTARLVPPTSPRDARDHGTRSQAGLPAPSWHAGVAHMVAAAHASFTGSHTLDMRITCSSSVRARPV